MVCSHRRSAEEGTSRPLLPETAEEVWNEPQHPQILLHLHCGEHPDRLHHHRLVWKQHRWQPQSSAKGCANCPPHCWRWASLPPGHLHQAVYKESQEDHQGLQPSIPQTALSLLPSGRRLRSIRSRTSRLRDSFFPGYQAENVRTNSPYITLPLTHHAMHCTLTPFYWTTRTHCNNTTYLLSLDTIQCTSTTLHMYNLLHLCTTIYCTLICCKCIICCTLTYYYV